MSEIHEFSKRTRRTEAQIWADYYEEVAQVPERAKEHRWVQESWDFFLPQKLGLLESIPDMQEKVAASRWTI